MSRKKDLFEIFEMGMRRPPKPMGVIHQKDRDEIGKSCKGIPRDVGISLKTGSLRTDE